MATILSIDLAYKNAESLGICLIHEAAGSIAGVEFPRANTFDLQNPIQAEQLADAIAGFSKRNATQIVLLDGPQGWKHPSNGLKHSRICERILNAPAKTGLVGQVKPKNYLRFVQFSIDVFQRLVNCGMKLVEQPIVTTTHGECVVAESLPYSAWRKLQIPGLPSKRRSLPRDIEERAGKLEALFGFKMPRAPTHDELQALVSGISGVPILAGSRAGYVAEGAPPKMVDAVITEGYIVNPRAKQPSISD